MKIRLMPFTALAFLACSTGSNGGGTLPANTVASVTLSQTAVDLASGVTITLSATAKDANGGTVSGKTATWSSSDNTIADVSSAGVVTGKRIGTATVTATIDGKSAPATVQVSVGAATAVSVVSGAGQSGEVGSAIATAPKVRVRDFGDNPVPGVSVGFSIGTGLGRLTGPVTVVTNANGEATAPAWNLGLVPGVNSLVATVGGFTGTVQATATYTRVTADRADEVAGNQVHLVYAVPADLADRSLDINGRIATTVTVFQRFATVKTNRRLKFDTYNGGALDVTFIRLTQTDAQIRAAATPQQGIEASLVASGFLVPGKVYLVYYDGTSANACAQSDLGPAAGVLGAAYLRGSFNGGTQACLDLTGMAETVTDAPRYWDFAMLHEILHTLGIVSAAAPHYVAALPGHTPEPTDLMYAGAAPWAPAEFDIGADDYAGSSLPGSLVNFLTSSYTETPPVAILSGARQASLLSTPWKMPSWVRMDLMEGLVKQ